MKKAIITGALAIASILGAGTALAQNVLPVPHKTYKVTTPDGLIISAQEWGNPAGREVVFIHGYSQSHLSWHKQVTDPELVKSLRMITYDLRGHGNSDKPLDPGRYKDSKLWANELKAVLDALAMKRPVLVGWSYGGRIISDYLVAEGPNRIAAINYVAAATKAEPSFYGDGVKTLGGMSSPDLATNIAATRAFLRACFEKQPEQADFETMVGFNMVMPYQVRMALNGRPLDVDAMMRGLKLPVLVTHGASDRIWRPLISQHTASQIPGAKLSIYEGIGHSPFWEDPRRFNNELLAFVTGMP